MKKIDRNVDLFEALGEEKTLLQWVEDPRCKCTEVRLFFRITKLGWDFPRALTTPPMKTGQPPHLFEVFEEKKTLREWMEDPRCKCQNASYIRRRIKLHGWSPQKAITTPIAKRSGSGKASRKGGKKGGRRKKKRKYTTITAWGLTLTFREWAALEGINIGPCTIAMRIREGWPVYDALSTPPRGKPPGILDTRFDREVPLGVYTLRKLEEEPDGEDF